MIELVDTHCHIQFADYELNPDEVIKAAKAEGVTRLLCVGCRLEDSEAAVAFAAKYDNIWASIGLHPHEAKHYVGDISFSPNAASKHNAPLEKFIQLASKPKVVAIGECGLDYYYNHSSKTDQQQLLRFQLSVAQEHDLPLIFHVREAFDDFFAILSDFEGVRGVVHSFTADSSILDKCLQKGLYIGLNGIMTFTKDAKQLVMAKQVPLERLLLETDAPFLTPVPFRGTICQPKHARVTAEFLADIRGETLAEIATATTQNAKQLFSIK